MYTSFKYNIKNCWLTNKKYRKIMNEYIKMSLFMKVYAFQKD